MFDASSSTFRLKAFIGLLLCVFAVESKIEAQQPHQSAGLTLSGTVLRFNKSLDGSRYDGVLRMQFRNDGTEPVIVYRVYDQNGIVSKRVDFFHQSLGTDIQAPDNKEILLLTEKEAPSNPFARYKRPNDDDFDPRPGIVRAFDVPRPSSAFIVIDPREYHEFQDTITIKTDVDLEKKQGSFVVEYDLSIASFEDKPDLLQILQNRWRRYGILPLDSSGHFKVKSQRILHIGKIG